MSAFDELITAAEVVESCLVYLCDWEIIVNAKARLTAAIIAAKAERASTYASSVHELLRELASYQLRLDAAKSENNALYNDVKFNGDLAAAHYSRLVALREQHETLKALFRSLNVRIGS